MTNNIKGILWAFIATGLFAVVAAMAKVAVVEYHVLQILFFRQVFVFLSALPSIRKSFPGSLKTKYPKIHGFRLGGAFIALSCSVWAVEFLPLTTAITLGFAQVFFVAVLAFLFLEEKVGIHRMVAVVMGFLGVLVVMRPGVEGIINPYTLIPVLGALGAAVAITSVRKLSQTESTATLLAYQAIFVGLLSGIPLFWLWTTPNFEGWLLLITMGVLATAGNWIGVKALRMGEASVVGNIEYVKLVYAAILGYFIFSEVPDAHTILGALVIIASSLYILHRESSNRNKT
ncbi:MAG: EamA family transporter [Gammaproteobacteria bacterium]|nr:EamA family transporter [Gammaproteobacteria bacterium]